MKPSKNAGKTEKILIIAALLFESILLTTAQGLIENNNSLGYNLDPGVRRNTLAEPADYALTYNVHPLTYPHIYEEGTGRLDLMLVQKPPRISDTRTIFNYTYIRGEVAWAALTLNLTAANATIHFDRTIDLTNVTNLTLDQDINLTFNYVYVNTTTMTAFNRIATITLKNLTFNAIKILKDESDCTDCSVFSYSGGQAVFQVQPTLTSYRAAELSGWVQWNTLDLVSNWVGRITDNKGLILVGAGEDNANSIRQYHSSNATDQALAPKLEINYTLPHIQFASHQSLTNVFDLDDYFQDLDSDTMTFQTSQDHPNVLITIDPDHTVDVASIGNWYGTQYAVFSASDGRGGTADSNNVTIEITYSALTTTTTTTTTTNAKPIVRGITGDMDITLTAGGRRAANYTVNVTDYNGCSQIYGSGWVHATLWDNNSVNYADLASNSTLYRNDTCPITCVGMTGTARCGFNLWYYATSSENWAVNFTAYDGTDAGSNATYGIAVQELIAVNVSLLLNFSSAAGGSMNLGETTANDANISITNFGNVQQDVLVSGTNMACTFGQIPVANIKYHSSPGSNYETQMCALTASSDDTCTMLQTDYNLQKTYTGVPSIKYVYWKLKAPTGGVGGLCSGNLTIGGLYG
ncbi:MAG: DNRLRE domain-containing protein [Candidatus Altiarchaeota archaeon]